MTMIAILSEAIATHCMETEVDFSKTLAFLFANTFAWKALALSESLKYFSRINVFENTLELISHYLRAIGEDYGIKSIQVVSVSPLLKGGESSHQFREDLNSQEVQIFLSFYPL